jgi:hypothetical protein
VEGEKEDDGDNEDDDKEEQEEAEEGEEEEAKAITAEEEDMAALTTAAHSPSFKGWIDRTTTCTTQVASSLPQSTWCRAFFFSPISVLVPGLRLRLLLSSPTPHPPAFLLLLLLAVFLICWNRRTVRRCSTITISPPPSRLLSNNTEERSAETLPSVPWLPSLPFLPCSPSMSLPSFRRIKGALAALLLARFPVFGVCSGPPVKASVYWRQILGLAFDQHPPLPAKRLRSV